MSRKRSREVVSKRCGDGAVIRVEMVNRATMAKAAGIKLERSAKR